MSVMFCFHFNAFGVAQKLIDVFLAVGFHNIEYLYVCLALFLTVECCCFMGVG